ncbi:MAG TPA: BglII/BstYI family type II restriction endonuclease [Chitinophagaceae bacterium]|nr:BglII/BstYI family type II restriction endonuclease [Chitinophagaceae bacterium]
MKIAQKYSHLNGEEYLLVHHKNLYKEIISIIKSIDASRLMTKESKEKTMAGKMLFSPIALNRTFIEKFRKQGWNESRYQYYVTTDRKLMQEIVPLPYEEQRKHLVANGIKNPISSYKQTDFVKDGIAVEVQFGKYAFVAFDLFVKHLLFYSGGIINVGIEVLPTKKMQSQMSSGVAYYEGEVYNVLRHGRGNPPVPLLILGIEP